jgi:hypothetical protein
MPTIDELRSFIRGCPYTEAGGECPVVEGYAGTGWCSGCGEGAGPGPGGCYWPPGFGSDCGWYWSSSSYAGSASNAWVVGFNSGYVYYYDEPATSYVRCVRRGP